MGGLLFPVLDEEKSFHAIFGLEWGVCAWIWSRPGMARGVSMGTVPFRFLLVALQLLISTPHSLVYFLLESQISWADFLFDMRSGKICSHRCLHWTEWVTKPRKRVFAQRVLSQVENVSWGWVGEQFQCILYSYRNVKKKLFFQKNNLFFLIVQLASSVKNFVPVVFLQHVTWAKVVNMIETQYPFLEFFFIFLF